MDIAAFIISIIAAIFAGVVALIAFREQKLRLRPHIYIDKINVVSSESELLFPIIVSNAGLLPAKNVTINPELQSGESKTTLNDDAFRSKAIVVPAQIIANTPGVKGQLMVDILQGKVPLHMNIDIHYEGNRQKYYYKAKYEFHPENRRWAILEGDAN